MKEIIAKRNMVLCGLIIPKETKGKISRISPRLKKSFAYKNPREYDVVVKFPGTASFFYLEEEIERL